MPRDTDLETDLLTFVDRRKRAARTEIVHVFSDYNERKVNQMIDFLVDDKYLLPVASDGSTVAKLRISSHGERRMKRLILSRRIGFKH